MRLREVEAYRGKISIEKDFRNCEGLSDINKHRNWIRVLVFIKHSRTNVTKRGRMLHPRKFRVTKAADGLV